MSVAGLRPSIMGLEDDGMGERPNRSGMKWGPMFHVGLNLLGENPVTASLYSCISHSIIKRNDI